MPDAHQGRPPAARQAVGDAGLTRLRARGAAPRARLVRRVGLGTFALLLAALHVVRDDLDPVRRYVSDYALGRGGLIFGVALGAYAVGVAAAAVGVASAPRPIARRPLLVGGLGTVAAGVAVAAVFLTDPPGVDTLPGAVHSAGATVAFVGTGLLALLTPLETSSGRLVERVLLGLVRVAPAGALVALVLVPDELGGAVERLVIAADVVWVELAPSRAATVARQG